MTNIRFNCGEFLPGKEPVGGGGGVINTVPPGYIPVPPRNPKPPFEPRPNEERRWYCSRTEFPCPEIRVPGPDGLVIVIKARSTPDNPKGLQNILAGCVECTKDIRGAWLPSLAECKYTSLEACINAVDRAGVRECISRSFDCEYPQTQTPGGTTGPGGPGPTGGGGGGGGGGESRFKCNGWIRIPCPDDNTRTLRFEPRCSPCAANETVGCVYASETACKAGTTITGIIQRCPYPVVTPNCQGTFTPAGETGPPKKPEPGPTTGPGGPTTGGPGTPTEEPDVPRPRGPTTGGGIFTPVGEPPVDPKKPPPIPPATTGGGRGPITAGPGDPIPERYSCYTRRVLCYDGITYSESRTCERCTAIPNGRGGYDFGVSLGARGYDFTANCIYTTPNCNGNCVPTIRPCPPKPPVITGPSTPFPNPPVVEPKAPGGATTGGGRGPGGVILPTEPDPNRPRGPATGGTFTPVGEPSVEPKKPPVVTGGRGGGTTGPFGPTGPDPSRPRGPTTKGPVITGTGGTLPGPIVIEPKDPGVGGGTTTGGGGPTTGGPVGEPGVGSNIQIRYKCVKTTTYCPLDQTAGYNVLLGPGSPRRATGQIRTPTICSPIRYSPDGIPQFAGQDVIDCVYASVAMAQAGISVAGGVNINEMCVNRTYSQNCAGPSQSQPPSVYFPDTSEVPPGRSSEPPGGVNSGEEPEPQSRFTCGTRYSPCGGNQIGTIFERACIPCINTGGGWVPRDRGWASTDGCSLNSCGQCQQTVTNNCTTPTQNTGTPRNQSEGEEFRYACAYRNVMCPDNSQGFITQRSCVPCRAVNGTWVIDDSTGTWISVAGCVATNCAQCDQSSTSTCLSIPQNVPDPKALAGTLEDEALADPANPNLGSTTGPRRPQSETLRTSNPSIGFSTKLVEDYLTKSVVVDTKSSIQSIVASSKKKEVVVVDLSDPNLTKYASPSATLSTIKNNTVGGLLDKTYTFFDVTPNQNTELVRNTNYLNIFNKVISNDVKYFLDRVGTDQPWTEYAIANLTKEKIAISISPTLMEAFNNIHDFAGHPTNVDDFLTTLHRLLITGRIDEFDPEYYIALSHRQRTDFVITYSKTGNSDETKRAALGLLSYGASSADPRNYLNKSHRNLTKRQRRLNTDIEANIPVFEASSVYTTFSDEIVSIAPSNVDTLQQSNVYLKDAGLEVLTFNESANNYSTNYVDIGDGFGYYFSALNFEGNALPLETTNELSASYFIPPDVRMAALGVLGFEHGITLTVSSLPGYHEFVSGYDHTQDLEPMYFALNLSTVGDGVYADTLINSVTGTYELLTSEEAAEHVKNYSLNTAKVNVDFRDPFIHYIKDSEIINLEQFDITFRAYSENRTMTDRNILTRNIPMALIITPGCGSKHNPYDGQSEITTLTDSITARKLTFRADIDTDNEFVDKAPLDEGNIHAETGKYFIGLYEQLNDQDPQSLIYKVNTNSELFNKSYFKGGQYFNTQPDVEHRTKSIEAQVVVDVVDKLINTYDVDNLTWWDIYRRLKLNQVGALNYGSSKFILKQIQNGWRGVPVIDVLSRIDRQYTGINQDLVEEDTVIISEEHRENAENY